MHEAGCVIKGDVDMQVIDFCMRVRLNWTIRGGIKVVRSVESTRLFTQGLRLIAPLFPYLG